MSMIEYQRKIMADSVRTAAFERALRAVVKPGCTVIDIGSGTGFLAFLASRLGAKRCILIEREPEFLKISKEMARLNAITNCTFIGGDSRDIKQKLQADVVVSETLGNFAYEENILETLSDARRFLKPEGIMIPQKLSLYAVPVIRDTQWNEVTSWNRVDFDLDWSPCKERSINNMYVKKIDSKDLLNTSPDSTQWDEMLFPPPRGEGPAFAKATAGRQGEGVKSIRHATLQWTLQKPVTIYGFCLWWEATLIPGITLSTSPAAPPTHLEQIFLPLPTPLLCKPKDTIIANLHSDSRRSVKINVQWEMVHNDKTGKELARYRMDMRNGI